MKSRRSSEALSEGEVDALLAGRAVAEHDDLRTVVALLRTASTVPAPTPTTALAAMLRDGVHPLPVAPVQTGSRWGRWSVRIAAVTAAAMTATLGAATANALPAPLQSAVADVVGAVTPLQLPRPASGAQGTEGSGGPADQPAGIGSPDSGADEPPSEATTATPVTAPSVPKAPSPAPPRAPAPTTAETSDSHVDPEPDGDDPQDDAPTAYETDADADADVEAEADEPDTETSTDASETDAVEDGEDVPDPEEPDLEVHAGSEQTEDDADD